MKAEAKFLHGTPLGRPPNPSRETANAPGCTDRRQHPLPRNRGRELRTRRSVPIKLAIGGVFVVSSNGDELYVHSRGGSERAEIVDVGREDVVSVAGECDERRIDRIHGVRRFEQHACAATQLGIEWDHIDTRQESRELRLASCPSSPYLRDNSAVRLWGAIRDELGLDERDDVPIMTLDRKESRGIE